jgi:hypothetical protein
MSQRMKVDLTNLVPMSSVSPASIGLATASARMVSKSTSPAQAAMATSTIGVRIPTPPKYVSRDWAIFLLHSAAEVEHALMVEYLYAAYSLRDNVPIPNVAGTTTNMWRTSILGIAKEEMGHLMTLQNILRLIGGPVNFEREDYPLRAEYYPFPFVLEPLSKNSLSKYLYAEMPQEKLPETVLTEAERDEIELRARLSAGVPTGQFINHVGVLYNTIIDVFRKELLNTDFRTDRDPFQSKGWIGTNDRIHPAGSTDFDVTGVKLIPVKDKASALDALEIIARQGEATDGTTSQSHFLRFLKIYRQAPKDTSTLVWPVRENPNTWTGTTNASSITNPTTRKWGELFNTRYRILLMSLSHLAALPINQGDPGIKAVGDILVSWVFEEMLGRSKSSIRGLAKLLASSPFAPTGTETAGAPFEMPYTLDLPDLGPDRWSLHLDLLDASLRIAKSIQDPPDGNEILKELLDADGRTQTDGRRKQITDHAKDAQ